MLRFSHQVSHLNSKASLPKSFSLSLAIVRMIIFVISVAHKYEENLERLKRSLVETRKLVDVSSPETPRFTFTNLCNIFYRLLLSSLRTRL